MKIVKIRKYQAVGKYDYYSEKFKRDVVRKWDIGYKLRHRCNKIRDMPRYFANILWCSKCRDYFESHEFVKIKKGD
jgi:hypothetical protein